jgi:hypothetical protein
MPSPALRSAPHEQLSNLRHADVLRRCAERDPNCLRDLEAAFGDQVRAVLTRALGSNEMAAFALPAVFADLRDRAGAFDPERQPAEDWVFGQVRRRLRELTDATTGQLAMAPQPSAVEPAPWRPTAFRPGQPLGAKLRPVIARTADDVRQDIGPPAGSMAQARATAIATPVRRPRRRWWSPRWRVGVAAAAVLAAVGVGLVTLPQRAGGPQVMAVPSRAPGAEIPARSPTGASAPPRHASAPAPALADPLPHPVSTPPPAASVTTRPPSGSAARPAVAAARGAPPGAPPASPEAGAQPPDSALSVPPPPSAPGTATYRPPLPGERPAADAAAQGERRDTAAFVPQAVPYSRTPPDSAPPVPRPAAPPVVEPYRPPPAAAMPPAEPAMPSGAPRVFIHHTAGSDPDAAAAQAVAERLRGQGFAVVAIRPVPFVIRKGSVRYYFEQDRAAARRLADLAGPLAGPGGPRPPLDFSHYQPKPSPGTVEVWVESR